MCVLLHYNLNGTPSPLALGKEAKTETAAQKWPFCMELPCRVCTDDNSGVEVRKPLSAFTHCRKMDELWKNAVSGGQDLVCYRCVRQKLHWGPRAEVIPCDHCGLILAKSFFNLEMQQTWEAFRDEPLYCQSCTGEGRKRTSQDMVRCNTCRAELPRYFFEKEKLTALEAEGASAVALRAECSKCVVKGLGLDATHTWTCRHCTTEKHFEEFTLVLVREWLEGGEASKHKLGCYDCVFPQCAAYDGDARCTVRPTQAVRPNAFVEGKYYCMDHRYPPCSGPNCASGANGKPQRRFRSEHRLKAWVCVECQKRNEALRQSHTCEFCRELVHESKLQRRDGKLAHHNVKCCLDCAWPTCAGCGMKVKEALPIADVREYTSVPGRIWCRLDTTSEQTFEASNKFTART